ncbi:MAG TPA: tetratricopeptide repeat protein [Pirellulales bacterium]|nr:tetratricopeptide repeat protein [Pirellulales bacterium]
MSSIRPAAIGFILVGVVGLAAMAIVMASASWLRGPAELAESVKPPPKPRHFTGPVVKPSPASQGYVGSEVCAKCHAAIAESYAHHPMYRSCGVTPGADDIEAFDERTEFQSTDGRQYRVETRDGEIYHHEMMRDGNGREIYDQAFKVSFYIGSGTRGKSYAIDHDGILVESPISWYTSNGGLWDLSPGYRPFNNQRFERRILTECVNCHSGRPALDADHENAFVEPVLLEAAIGCERCHGPGQKHVELQESATPPSRDSAIVNPLKLTSDRRDAVCNQCHLQGKQRVARYGRLLDDFRPGDRLDDVMAVLVAKTGVRADGRTKSVSQVEQMNDSECFKQSEGRLGCTSCHDPHAHVSGDDKAAHYRARCMECHEEHGCSLAAEKRQAPPANDSCIYCHMPRLSSHDVPHTSQTDHRIVRRAEPELLQWEGSETASELVLFDLDHTPMPDWEIERVVAYGKLHEYEQQNYGPEAELLEIEQTLRAVVELAPDDFASWFALGSSAVLRHDLGAARPAWEHVLEIKPQHEPTLNALVNVCQNSGDPEAALGYLDRLIALNPWRARDQARRATLLADLGDWPQAAEAGEAGLRLDPTDNEARRWLIGEYQKRGDLARAERHAQILQRISESRMSTSDE